MSINRVSRLMCNPIDFLRFLLETPDGTQFEVWDNDLDPLLQCIQTMVPNYQVRYGEITGNIIIQRGFFDLIEFSVPKWYIKTVEIINTYKADDAEVVAAFQEMLFYFYETTTGMHYRRESE